MNVSTEAIVHVAIDTIPRLPHDTFCDVYPHEPAIDSVKLRGGGDNAAEAAAAAAAILSLLAASSSARTLRRKSAYSWYDPGAEDLGSISNDTPVIPTTTAALPWLWPWSWVCVVLVRACNSTSTVFAISITACTNAVPEAFGKGPSDGFQPNSG